jgi:acyl-CoA-dependent ceramide synthase
MVNPETSLQLISMVLAAWAGLEITLPSGTSNPLSPLIFISYPLKPVAGEDEQKVGKGPKDLAFLGFYIVVFSFLRQSITEYLVRPLAKRLGLKSESKTQRFMEQAYGIIYWGGSGALGLYVMSRQDSWWYRTEHFWLDYPNHWSVACLATNVVRHSRQADRSPPAGV